MDLDRGLGERPGPCWEHEVGLAREGEGKQDEAGGACWDRPVSCALERRDSCDNGAQALMGLTCTPGTLRAASAVPCKAVKVTQASLSQLNALEFLPE